MRTPTTITLIILGTFFMIGTVYLIIKKNSLDNKVTTKTNKQELAHKQFINKPFMITKEEMAAKNIVEKEEKNLSQEDQELIQNIASMDDNLLATEMHFLRELAKEKRLGELIALQDTEEQVVVNAKKTLEKLAIMGLETTRRRFLEKEPCAEEVRFISVLSASFTDCDVGKTFVTSSSSFTIFTPSSYFLAYLPRMPLEKSYSFFIF